MSKLFKNSVILIEILIILMLNTIIVFAAEFIDMPNDYTTDALKNAVKNGLLYGEETSDKTGQKINPNDNITRAQMAAIIARAFGTEDTADISKYTDVDKNAWYYTELSKAVAMGAFKGDGNLMNPQKNITFQECYTVISQIFQLQKTSEKAVPVVSLDKFTDADEIADWAVPHTTAVVSHGYWNGINGKLLPTTYITRSQFAVLMDNIIKIYIDEPGTYSKNYDGNVMVRTDGVTLSGAHVDGDLIIGDGVLDGITIDDTTIDRCIFIRGGGENMSMQNGSTAKWAMLLGSNQIMKVDETSDNLYGGDRENNTSKFIVSIGVNDNSKTDDVNNTNLENNKTNNSTINSVNSNTTNTISGNSNSNIKSTSEFDKLKEFIIKNGKYDDEYNSYISDNSANSAVITTISYHPSSNKIRFAAQFLDNIYCIFIDSYNNQFSFSCYDSIMGTSSGTMLKSIISNNTEYVECTSYPKGALLSLDTKLSHNEYVASSLKLILYGTIILLSDSHAPVSLYDLGFTNFN